MKPNCLFSRLDRLNYQNGYYRVLMGLTEDILGSVSLSSKRFGWILNPQLSLLSLSPQLGWDIYLGSSAEYLPSGEGNREQPWSIVPSHQLPNVCEEQ